MPSEQAALTTITILGFCCLGLGMIAMLENRARHRLRWDLLCARRACKQSEEAYCALHRAYRKLEQQHMRLTRQLREPSPC